MIYFQYWKSYCRENGKTALSDWKKFRFHKRRCNPAKYWSSSSHNSDGSLAPTVWLRREKFCTMEVVHAVATRRRIHARPTKAAKYNIIPCQDPMKTKELYALRISNLDRTVSHSIYVRCHYLPRWKFLREKLRVSSKHVFLIITSRGLCPGT